MTQAQALEILKSGLNVFLTGEPGSGKTHVVNEYVAYLRAHEIEPAITASTGIAATHINGRTIHSWAGIGIKNKLSKSDLKAIVDNKYIEDRVQNTKILIIDEVSMLAANTLSMVDLVCRGTRKNPAPFGGLQVILVGDFFQLPPVIKEEENSSQTSLVQEPKYRFAYDAPVWDKMEMAVCYLTDQYRQDDKLFLSLLSAIREGTFNNSYLQHIQKRKVKIGETPSNALKLFSHNTDVDRINDEHLNKLPGEAQDFFMTSRGKKNLVASMIKNCLSPETLSLKINTVVMFTKNNLKEGFVNGTTGIVEGFDKENGFPIVRTKDGRKIWTTLMDWTVEEGGEIRARITQLPLRLAWAITVHKSQGMSLDEAVMDLSKVFEFGQGYVALSRVRRLSGIYIFGWNEHTFQISPDVLQKDKIFREKSQSAEKLFSGMGESQIKNRQKNFIMRCEGKISSTKKSKSAGSQKGYNVEEIRKEYPNAYTPWDEMEDGILKNLFTNDTSITDIAKAFGRKRGAIRSRLVKLGFINK